MSTDTTEFHREPKQSRSRASLERLLRAAADLLIEKGYAEFTLQEVSKRANVSIGSIYNRFNSKENLIRQVQRNELEALEVDSAVAINMIRRQNLKLRQLVPAVIRQYGDILRKDQGILRPLMEISVVDEVVREIGKQHAWQNTEDFLKLLLECKDEITQPDPTRAVHRGVMYAYSALSRFLGLGFVDSTSGEEDWDEMLEDLSEITLHYLLGHPDNIR